MSFVYFLASDIELKEMDHPYLNYINGKIRFSRPFSSAYLSIHHVQEEYKLYPITRKYVSSLDFRLNPETFEILITYMREHLQYVNEMELWSIWLDGNQKIKSKKILIGQFTYDFLDQFWEMDMDINDHQQFDIMKLTVFRKFY